MSCQAKAKELKTNYELAIAAEQLDPFVYKKIQEIINHPGLVRMELITSFVSANKLYRYIIS